MSKGACAKSVASNDPLAKHWLHSGSKAKGKTRKLKPAFALTRLEPVAPFGICEVDQGCCDQPAGEDPSTSNED